jgi:hypothetical protein
MERLARDKHFSSLQKFVNYGQKSFITLSPDRHFLTSLVELQLPAVIVTTSFFIINAQVK